MIGFPIKISRTDDHVGIVDGEGGARLAGRKRSQIRHTGVRNHKCMARTAGSIRGADRHVLVIQTQHATIAPTQCRNNLDVLAVPDKALRGRQAVHEIAAGIHPAANIAAAVDGMGNHVGVARHIIDQSGMTVAPYRGIHKTVSPGPICNIAIAIQGYCDIGCNGR